MSNQWQYFFLISLFAVYEPIESSLNIQSLQVLSKQSIEQVVKSDVKNNYCSQEVESLTDILLKELPDYSNRVIQRTQNLHQEAGISTYIVAAGKAEFEPLDLPQIEYNTEYNTEAVESTKQIFFTTLERQYITRNLTAQLPKTRKIERQTYHWLFLTPTNHGWRMVAMFSIFGSSEQDNLPTPPQESSNGIIGQAIQLWLRDCRAGKIITP